MHHRLKRSSPLHRSSLRSETPDSSTRSTASRPGPHPRGEVLVRVLKHSGYGFLEPDGALRKHHAALQQESANLVDHRSSSYHQPVSHPVQRLQVQLIVGLDRNEAHVVAIYCFGNRLGIDKVVLVRLHKGFYELSWDQLHIVALCSQRTAQKMCSRTCRQPDERRLEVRGEGDQLLLGELLLQ